MSNFSESVTEAERKRRDKARAARIGKMNSRSGDCEHCGATTLDGVCELCNPTRDDDHQNLFDEYEDTP